MSALYENKRGPVFSSKLSAKKLALNLFFFSIDVVQNKEYFVWIRFIIEKTVFDKYSYLYL